MDAWERLGIEPTRNLKAIKIAYANMSKKYHPEEYPEEFKQLQDAYKAAVRFAKGNQDASMELQEQKYDGFWEQKQTAGNARENQKEDKSFFFSYEEIPQVSYFDDSYEERFFRQLEYMLWHPYMRDSVMYWKCFMQQEKYEMLMRDEMFRDRFLKRLCQENYYYHYEVRDYFVELWKVYTDEDIKSQLIKDRILTLKSTCFTKNEKNLYDQLWKRRSHSEGKEADNYMKEYFRYAEANEEKLLSVYREANHARVMLKEKRISVVRTIFYIILIGLILLLGLRWIRLIILVVPFLWSKLKNKK